jgi:anthranilate phosphoribosyltransferase
VLGVFSAEAVDVVAGALAELGTEHAFVAHGAGNLDEISLAGPTVVAEVRSGAVRRFSLRPEDFGKQAAPLAAIRGGGLVENATLIEKLLAGDAQEEEGRARRDIVVINASAALVAAGVTDNFREGAEFAERALADGTALSKLDALRRYRGT